MKSHNLRTAPKCPFGDLQWRDYYWEKPGSVPEYEEDYWGHSVRDPDGNLRNMLSQEEWKKQVEDLEFIVGKIHELPYGRLLDVGCGPGYLLSAIGGDWDKHGVDVSAVALKSAGRFAQVRQGQFPAMDYETTCFDVVVMNHVVEHVPNPLDYIHACRRVLKPGGRFIVATPDFDCGCARYFGSNFRMLHDKGHINLFTSLSLIKMLEDTGFQIAEVEYPYFNTRWFTRENLLRMLDNSKVSPPFYGNHVIVVASNALRNSTDTNSTADVTVKTRTLKGERIDLKELGMDALNDMFEYSKNPAFYSHMELLPHQTLNETKKYLTKLLARVRDGHAVYWGIHLKKSGKMIGTFGVVDIDIRGRRAQIGYGISPSFWNQGFFAESLQLTLDYCFNTIGLNRVSATTFADNQPSIKGLLRAGFREEGCLRDYYCNTDGHYFDAMVFGLLRKDFGTRGVCPPPGGGVTSL